MVKIKPNGYFNNNGKIKFCVYGSWYYSPLSNKIPDAKNWRFLKTVSSELEFDLFNQLLPKKALKNPGNSQINADLFYRPELKVNYVPESEVILPESDEDVYFKYDLTYQMNLNGNQVGLSQNIVSDSLIYLNCFGLLSPNKEYNLSVSIDWYVSQNNKVSWEKCNELFTETLAQKIVTGSTVTFSDTIVDSDVDFMYPLNRQFNYLEEEYQKGYIKFKNIKAQKWFEMYNPVVEIKNVKTEITMHSLSSYNSTYDIFEYDLSAGFLSNNEVYKISFKDTVSSKIKYEYYFKTSKYNSFSEKWTVLKNSFDGKARDISLQIINVTINDEILDYYEILSNEHNSSSLSLIQFETHIPESWKSTADWLIYSQPSLEFQRKNATTKIFGFPPIRAIYYLAPDWYAIKLSDNSLNGTIVYPSEPWLGIFVWEVQNFMRADASSATTVAKTIPESERSNWQNIAAQDYPEMPRLWLDFALGGDTYPLLDVYYVLPGINIETTKITNIQL